ncbi:MAG: pirin family protein [Polyangiaceae bacterium]
MLATPAATCLAATACHGSPKAVSTRRATRALTHEISGVFSRDGAGVRLRRSIGSGALQLLDPFLLLDEIHSNTPEDYARGFPQHPHRGFETVTYMLEGEMVHRDSVGNHGLLTGGSAQWMTAGRGIVHSEMPRAELGGLWGLQLWVNLPKSLKMTAPRYQDVPPSSIPELLEQGCRVRVVAGNVGRERGPISGIEVEPLFLDVSLPSRGRFEQQLEPAHTAFLYVLAGEVRLPDAKPLLAGSLGVLGAGDLAALSSDSGGRALLIAGRALNEPVARRGPFVMNDEAELEQAFEDYRSGRLTSG